jgi:lysophospholipase L1-like esterase
MLLEKGDKLVFIGDSITDCGRQQPVGEGSSQALGFGYVSLVDALLGAAHPELHIRVANMGIGGNTVRDLQQRWHTDVIDLKPDWLSIMIGINDVWRQFDHPNMPELHVNLNEYEKTLRDLVQRTRPLLKGLVMMSPFYLEALVDDPMRQKMDQYGSVARQIAEENQAVFVDVQAVFDTLLNHQYSATLAQDRVHPSLVGHMAIARAFLKGIGFSR